MTSLREFGKTRIFEDMIGYTQSRIAALASDGGDLEAQKKKEKSASRRGGAAAGAAESSTYLVMVVDAHTLKVLSGSCKNFSILERGVTVVEQLEKERQSTPDFDALYFLSPTEKSVKLLLEDFQAKPPMYQRAHVFFCNKLSDQLMDVLAKNGAFVNRCVTLVELFLDHVNYDARVFQADDPLALTRPEMGGLGKSVGTLVSLCATLKEKPSIRFARNSQTASGVAAAVKKELDELWGKLDKLGTQARQATPATTLLVLDRMADLSAVFLHEFFYEAFALDVLDGKSVAWSLGVADASSTQPQSTTCNATFSFEFQTSAAKKGEATEPNRKQAALLSEEDALFARLRNLHFSEAQQILGEEVANFKAKHATLASIQKGERSVQGDLLAALRAVPEYQELMKGFWQHLELVNQLNAAVNDLKLLEVTKVEHELVTGVDEEAKEVNMVKLAASVSGILQHGGLKDEEKFRLILLYLLNVEGISETNFNNLARLAQLKPMYVNLISTLTSLQFLRPLVADKGAKLVHTLAANRNLMKKNKDRALAAKMANSRFVSKIVDSVEALLTGEFDDKEFPTVDGSSAKKSLLGGLGKTSSSSSSAPKSAAAQWGLSSATGADDMRTRLIVYVVGGVTFNEVRLVDALSLKYTTDVFLGGSTVLTAKRAVEALLNAQ